MGGGGEAEGHLSPRAWAWEMPRGYIGIASRGDREERGETGVHGDLKDNI